jgi:hypothetical protein
MNIEIFNKLRAVLLKSQWLYHSKEDVWSVGKCWSLNGPNYVTNNALISIINTESVVEIAYFFIFVLRKNNIVRSVIEILPQHFCHFEDKNV